MYFSNSPISFLATTANEVVQLIETVAATFNLIIPDGWHCHRLAIFWFASKAIEKYKSVFPDYVLQITYYFVEVN